MGDNSIIWTEIENEMMELHKLLIAAGKASIDLGYGYEVPLPIEVKTPMIARINQLKASIRANLSLLTVE